MLKPKFSTHYISGTHWDREWYRPLQEYRLVLVRLIDELLDIMETNPAFRYFHLDGQTCVLQDYLDVRPENRERLARLIRAGRILVGPWFTMPDLFCTGDEALVRNLLLGRRVSREWGVEPMPIAYTCDMFGHPSQMPQIYNGFGLKHCVLGRGTNEHRTPMFFQWEAPDGSRVFTFKLQDAMGYGAFAVPRAFVEMKEKHEHLPQFPEVDQELTAAGDDRAKRAVILEKWCRKKIAEYLEHEMGRANAPVVCIMDAMDHIMPASDVAGYLARIHESCPQAEARHSTLPAFFAEAERGTAKPPVKRGELREPAKSPCAYLYLIPYCPSARVRMKQANDAALTVIERWAEPLLAVANTGGAGIPERFLRLAWEHILLNHAHDSICGCSIDQVHRDVMYRFDQARILGTQLQHQGFGALSAGYADLARAKDEFTVSVFSPVPLARKEVVVFDIDLPTDYPAKFHEGFRTQDLKAFVLADLKGRPVPYQRLAFQPVHSERSRFAKPCFISDGDVTRYRVAAELDLPGLGFTSLLVKPSAKPVRAAGTLRTGPTAAENEHLALCVESNGTLTITDKAARQTYTGLLTFESRNELGDGWFHGHSLNDEVVLSTASAAQVSVVHEGPELVAFRSSVTLNLPARYDWSTEKPARATAPVTISSVVALRRGARTVEVETTVDNRAEDHRLRLLLPTDAAAAKTWLAHHPYDLVERRIALDARTGDWQEMEVAEKPFLGLQAVGAGRRGLAFLSAGGLHEGGVADDARRTMQVTLLRSFRRTVGTYGEQDGLEKGETTFRYALMPYAGELPRAAALAELAKLQAGLLIRQTGPRPSGYPAMTGKKPPRESFLTLRHGRLILSAFKPADDGNGLIVRLWNPTGKAASETLTFWRRFRRATLVNLAEDSQTGGRLKAAGAKVAVTAGPHAIVTIRVEFNTTKEG